MTKIEFVDAVAKETEWTKKDSEEAINAVVKVITNALVAGEKLSIVGFGTFEVVERAAREGRNPQTGESIMIKACKMPKFKPGKAFKELINA
ncbi:HU family DNA-binding protein [Blautia massiliensis (ex Durand et al. 2017)]|uniref:HU family DNA-binding protein n=1 Tax=Blautia massiliensis (ex Durand et al. 2017) TaxID=1737424 RepID=UPI00156DB400|nr:HU family DNA-binding protein [Blautia massiliensis (ex Durand et al. 2017)]NSK76398.1 HU family DNA-binding protein [Blautia massiliensis (ex Durand et al. 2017)]